MPTAIIPDNKEHWLNLRAHDITSTDVSALFGLSPYKTEYELYVEKSGVEQTPLEETERMKWGTRLQDAIAKGVADDNGWKCEPFKEYVRLDDMRLGSSFDFKIETNEGYGILEIKNVDRFIHSKQWFLNEAPPHIELQVQHQMLVSGLSFAYIAALVGGNEVVLFKRRPSDQLFENIKSKAKRFWECIETKTLPEANPITDARAIIAMLKHVDTGSVIEATKEIEALANKYKQHSDEEKAAQKQKEITKAEILKLIGDTHKVKGETFSISAGEINKKEYTVAAKSYRDFRITWKKGMQDE